MMLTSSHHTYLALLSLVDCCVFATVKPWSVMSLLWIVASSFLARPLSWRQPAYSDWRVHSDWKVAWASRSRHFWCHVKIYMPCMLTSSHHNGHWILSPTEYGFAAANCFCIGQGQRLGLSPWNPLQTDLHSCLCLAPQMIPFSPPWGGFPSPSFF